MYIHGLKAGYHYAYRVHGPFDPTWGQRCNPSKLLIDPYAKAVEGRTQWNEALYSYRFDNPDEKNDDDSGPFAQRSVVIRR